MLRLFKSNHPLVVALVLAAAVLLHLKNFLHPESVTINFDAPLAQALAWLLHLIPFRNEIVETVFCVLLLFTQAIYFNYILDKYKIVERGNYTGAYIFILLSCMLPAFLALTPAFVANFFLLLEIDFLFSVYKKEKAGSEIFDLGFFISVASLIYFPSLAFIVFLLLGMLVLRPLRISEWFVMFTGVLVTYFLCGVYFFWFDRLGEFFSGIKFFIPSLSDFSFLLKTEVWVISVFIFFLLMLSLTKIQTNYFKTLVQIRNYFWVLVFFSLLGFLSVFLKATHNENDFIWMVIAAAVAFTYTLPLVKKQWVAEVLHLILLLFILFFQFEEQLNLF